MEIRIPIDAETANGKTVIRRIPFTIGLLSDLSNGKHERRFRHRRFREISAASFNEYLGNRNLKIEARISYPTSKLIATWRRDGCVLGVGAGIAQDYATLGQIGFSERSGYTAIGTVCNLAARLCAKAKDGQILVSSRVARAVEAVAKLENLGNLELKGLRRPVAAFNVVHRAARPPAPGSRFDAMTILIVSWKHPFAGTSRSRRRTRSTPAPASAGKSPPTRPQSARRVWRQQSVRDHQQVPARGELGKTSPGNAAAATNPHRRSSVHRFPAGSFFRGFRTPASYRIDRSCSGRHPKPFRIAVIRPRDRLAEVRYKTDRGTCLPFAPENPR
jgi:hypothetical protein